MNGKRNLHDLSELKQLLPQDSSNEATARIGHSTRTHDGKGKVVKVVRETKGRKGKIVTLVVGFQHNPLTMEEIATILKRHCGAGGTVKEGNIEIQGDQCSRITEKLRELNYVVK
jgi:translation initiation factor 1